MDSIFAKWKKEGRFHEFTRDTEKELNKVVEDWIQAKGGTYTNICNMNKKIKNGKPYGWIVLKEPIEPQEEVNEVEKS